MSITTSALREEYENVAKQVMPSDMRECERDVMNLLEYETDWAGVRDAVNREQLSDEATSLYLRMMATSNVSRARRAVSSFSDGEYERVKMRYREMHGWEYD